MGDNNKKPKKNWLIYFILGGFIVKIARFLFKKETREDIKDNIADFVKAEKKEIKELKKGKESFIEYCRDSGNIFRDYFIPNECNGHKPKILRTHSLVLILVFAVLLKAAITGYLFFIYPNQAKMEETIIKEILELTNNDRSINNIEQLTLDPALSAAAFAKADDMLKNGYFSHYSPDGKKPWDWISRGSYAYLFVGENLAMDFSSAESVHDALMQSPSHRKNILNGTYKDIGLAVVTGEFDGRKTNILVELFASQKPATIALNPTPDHTAGTSNQIAVVTGGTKVLSTETAKTETTTPATKTPAPATKPAIIAKPKPAPATSPVKPVDPAASTTPAQAPATASSAPALADITPQSSSDLMKFGVAAKTASEQISPNQELIDKPSNKIIYIASTDKSRTGLANRLINYSRYIFLSIALLLILILAANIMIEVTVQHKSVIVQTLLLIALIGGLAATDLHILEQIAQKVALI